MKNSNKFTLPVFVAALLLLAVGAVWVTPVFAQSQGAQTLSTTTLSAVVPNVNGGSGITSGICLTSISNVYATVAVQTTLFVDTEAMDVVTNSIPPSGTCLTVTRGTHGTKAEGHVSGRTVYVSRPNLFQGFDVAGTCWSNAAGTATLPPILPWINLTDGNVYQCYSDGNWFLAGHGSYSGLSVGDASSFCSGTSGSAETEYLNGAACSGATTSTFRYTVPFAGELANLQVSSSANVVGGTSKDVLTVYVNGTATAITCTMAASTKVCSDNTHGVAVAAGALVTFQWVTATSDTAANLSASVGIYSN
jgi:hypothetical protein